ncbi:hypothetical protein Nepgr_023802 [Nepenthes gracilis]|uniref:DDT domain-containing protein n=1 Tax=Nepenthes gracilis TaxID=150966 RepID=A0AAD3XZF4_NEPGR|nr:hypothetical protein Nepgr_023802 [Nepenthes gracilis]
MQTYDGLSPNASLIGPNPDHLDLPTMGDAVSAPIHHSQPSSPHQKTHNNDNTQSYNGNATEVRNTENNDSESKISRSNKEKNGTNSDAIVRRERPSRACTARAAASKLYVEPSVIERRPKPAARRERGDAQEEVEEEEQKDQSRHIVTPLVNSPPAGQFPRWNLRAAWELASILNFLNIFRPLLKITVEFSAEELETALITPNNTLGDIHIPLLKAIPPVTRMACGRGTWVTVLCRKLRDWWHWVADGEIPIFASHGAEIEVYKSLDPRIRVVILKALCDIRVEQEDIRNYIDDSVKHGAKLSAFRKERIGGDSTGISYWYEDDPIIGHRLYREFRKVEVKKVKMKGSHILPNTSYKWETVATNLDEFQDVSEKLFSSKNRTEASLGKKLKNDMLPEIEKIHKRKEKLLKKQQRQTILLDNIMTIDGLAAGRSLRDRKPVTYTFDDYDRSINEAIKITKRKQQSPEPGIKREAVGRYEPSVNGGWTGPSQAPHLSFSAPSPPEYDEMEDDLKPQQPLDRSNRRRQRPQRYSEKEFVEAVSDNEADFDSDDEIVGEAVYDEEYLRKRKHRKKLSSSSEGDEEYQWSEENGEEEEEEDSLSVSEEDSDQSQRLKKMPDRARRGAKLRSVDELQTGLRRSKRAARTRINYRQYDLSESDSESTKTEKSNASDRHSDVSDNTEYSMDGQDSEGHDEGREMEVDQPDEDHTVEKEQTQASAELDSPRQNDDDGSTRRRFLDLNELAPSSGFDDGPGALTKDERKPDL